MDCPSPIWELDDFTACFRHIYLQAVLPLLVCAISLVVLLIQVASRLLCSPFNRHFGYATWQAVAAYDDSEFAQVGEDSLANGWHQTPNPMPNADTAEPAGEIRPNKSQLAYVVAEELAVVLQIAITLVMLLWTDAYLRKGPLVVVAVVGTWIYIFALNLLRIAAFTRGHRFLCTLWSHAVVLYACLFILALPVARSIAIHPLQQDLLNALQITSCVLSFVLVIIIALGPVNSAVTLVAEGAKEKGLSGEARASLSSIASFSWVAGLVWTGYKRTLELPDVWALASGDRAVRIIYGFRQPRSPHGLTWRLLHYFRWQLLVQAAWAILLCASTFAPTLLLKALLEYVEAPLGTPKNVAWLYVILMFVSSIITALADGQAVWTGRKISMKLRSIVIGEIYDKALRRKASAQASTILGTSSETGEVEGSIANSQTNVGTIINLISVDSFNVSEVAASLYLFCVSVPIQIVISLALLYGVLGLSALPGVAVILLLFPVNSAIAKKFGEIQMQVMAATDVRIETANEFIRNIRIIKFFAWESQGQKIIGEKRSRELQILRSRYMLWSVAATIWYGAPVIVTFLSFWSYTMLQGKDLKPSLAFTAVSLFGLLKIPLDQFADTLARIQSSKVSVDRIEEFLAEGETDKYRQLEDSGRYSDEGNTNKIGFDKATFTWNMDLVGSPSSERPFTLKNVDVNFNIGSLNLIVGPTGSGKSSMLMALLGEMTLRSGMIYAPHYTGPSGQSTTTSLGLTDSIAYCAQTAWLTNDTIKQNILFASPWNAERYREVITACALEHDLEMAHSGDMTVVGENGISLSGGQKQRISLARAIYSPAKHVLLDDCLSAVDAHTARWIVDRCINGPLMQNRTCVLATHHVTLCIPRATLIVVLDGGEVVASGSPETVVDSGILGEELKRAKLSMSQRNPMISTSPTEEIQDVNESGAKGNAASAEESLAPGVSSPESLDFTEGKAEGKVEWSIIRNYLAAVGGPSYWIFFSAVFVAQLLGSILTNIWIRHFSNAYLAEAVQNKYQLLTSAEESMGNGFFQKTSYRLFPSHANSEVNVPYYLTVYALILLAYLIVTFLRMLIASLGSLAASRKVHSHLLKSIFGATFAFFDRTPQGQIMNRFSKDIELVDQELASMALGTIHFVGQIISIIILIAIITPAFLIAGMVISAMYFIIGKLYINSSRDLKRLESLQRSPLFQHFGESLTGTVTIRAYGEEARFQQKNLDRIDKLNQPFICLWAVDRWLSFRLDIIGGLVSLIAGGLAILGVGRLDAGAVGLSLTYAITFSENVLWLVRYHALNQQNFTSVERIQEFVDVEQEKLNAAPDMSLPDDWPAKGSVQFVNYSTRYRSELDPVLKNINIKIKAKEKVGVVGRTGAGKSSLALAILRALEPETGSIYIDNIDISRIGLDDLRQAVTIIPQDPILFSGTLRFNLDLFGVFSDAELLKALQDVQLITSSAAERPENPESIRDREVEDAASHPTSTFFTNLSSTLIDSGANISQGQRQLICIARAILRKSKLIIMDEATASIDHTTDSKIHRVMDSLAMTNITIAHRLNTIINFDKLLVLHQGEVAEFDHPWMLLQRPDGMFRRMCEASGDIEGLENLAREAWQRSASG